MLAAGNVGVQTLTIRQNLHSVSFSVRLKISLRRCCLSSMQSPGGICSQIRSAYISGVSAVLARPCQNVRALQSFAAANILTLFSKKNQKPNSAHKCPITSIQVCTESQKLSEFSCITFGSLNRGRPPFQLLLLKITNFCPWGGGRTVGRGGASSQLILITQPQAVQQARGVGGEGGGSRGW
jgi:hypothetical protein